jgi:catechol 2,3-dioxygenase-like lactoylglutathione lyase family enzyme
MAKAPPRRWRLGLAIAAACLLGAATPGLAQPVASKLVLDHVGLQVVDLDRSTAFYTQVLGLKEVPAPFPRTAGRWFDLGGGRMLHTVAGGVAGAPHNKWDHFALSCADITQVEADLDRLHVPWTGMGGARVTDTRPDGAKQIFIRDPDGYAIEINDGARGR